MFKFTKVDTGLLLNANTIPIAIGMVLANERLLDSPLKNVTGAC